MFFFFNDTATTEIYTLSLHDALPILMNPLSAKAHQILTVSCWALWRDGAAATLDKVCWAVNAGLKYLSTKTKPIGSSSLRSCPLDVVKKGQLLSIQQMFSDMFSSQSFIHRIKPTYLTFSTLLTTVALYRSPTFSSQWDTYFEIIMIYMLRHWDFLKLSMQLFRRSIPFN